MYVCMSVIELRTKFDEMFWVDIFSRTGTNQSYLEHPAHQRRVPTVQILHYAQSVV